MATVKKNFIYNLCYQIFALITPFVTAPYVARVLGSAGVGQYSYAHTIVTYFTILGCLGFGYYTQREIAASQKDIKEQSKLFWEIQVLKTISLVIALIAYVIVINLEYFNDYRILLYVLSISLLSNIFDISFFFQGKEMFSQLAIRNSLVRIIGILLLFLFVKTSDDVWIYALSQAIISLIANVALWPLVSRNLVPVQRSELIISRHIVPVLKLFIPTLAVSLYTLLDKILIEALIPGEIICQYNDGSQVVSKVSDVENGYYSQAEQIVKLTLTIFFSLSSVMVSRNADDFSRGKIDSFNRNISNTVDILCITGFPIMMGLIALSNNFCPWFLGLGYEKVPNLIIIFSPLVLFIGLSNILGRQYLIPQKRDNEFTVAICSGAIINVLLNVLLIPRLYSYGAAFASITAEFAVVLVMVYMIRNEFSIWLIIKRNWKSLLASSVMFLFLFYTQSKLLPSIINTIVLFFEGSIIYLSLLFVLRDRIFFALLRTMHIIR